MKNKLYYQFAGSCFLLVFMFLTYVVRFYPGWLKGYDQTLTRLVRGPYPAWNDFYLTITKIGNPLSVVSITIVVFLLLLLTKRYTEAMWFGLGTVGVAGIGNTAIKMLVQRERPSLKHLVEEFTYSFPSGHSTGSMILFGSLILLIGLLVKNQLLRWGLQIFLGLLIFTIGISRIYLGVHYPSDITAGFCLGLSWLLLSYPYFAEKRFIWRFQGKQR